MLIISFILIGVSSILFPLGILCHDYNLILFSIIFLWCGGVVFSWQQIQKRIVLLLFLLSMFLFLIGRPVISLLRGNIWWQIASGEAVILALLSLYVSILFLLIGACFSESKVFTKYKSTELKILEDKRIFLQRLRQGALFVFCVAIICTFLEGFEKIAYMFNHTYVEYYTSYRTQQPLIVKGFIQLMKPTLCIFLATMPSKRKAFLPLLAYLLSTIPYLLVGMRSPTLLACSFIFIYYFIRDINRIPYSEKWIGLCEKIIILLSIPLMIVFLFAYTYWRNNNSVDLFSGENLLFRFIYQQGNSFDVLVKAFDVLKELPENKWPGYTLGPVYDNLVHNNIIGRTLFNTVPTNIQTQEALQISHDMKAHLSYILMGNMYFQGHGVGVVYILEVFSDFGWFGVIIYNFILGICLERVIFWIQKNWLLSTISIFAFFQLFYTPRSDALYMVMHLVHPYFWIAISGCYLIGRIRWKVLSLSNIRKVKMFCKQLRAKT
ncbi:O-antigen polysaccharide polymerase Wzy family protein [Clostridium transplantifaecale]|uniref:O-antigen polysaccharide polymerase Wzy family protein n=1 Tax=Clostridium transplantifaecale TaxID=2479838 RepID=UPI000F639422|nr:O-antigen polysaccharide polymerase Wzy family protein [Clostridium transplantifaecale]